MKKKTIHLTAEFEALNNASILFGIGMMSNSNGKWKIFANYICIALNLCLIGTAHIIEVGYTTDPTLSLQDSVSLAISSLKQILGLVTTVSIYFQVVCRRTTIWTAQNGLRKADSKFSNLNIAFSYKIFNRLVQLSLVATLGFNFSIFCALLVHYGITSFDGILLKFFVQFHSMIIVYLVMLLDVFLCWLVRMKFRALRLLLSELCQFRDDCNKTSNWKIKLVEENPKIFFGDLIKISEIYEILYNVVCDLNSTFGLFCLNSIGFASISLTCHVFLLFKAVTEVAKDEIENGMKLEVLIQVFWIMLFLVPLILLITVCYSTDFEANSVSMVLHETVAGKRIGNSAMQLEMDLIALQMLHQQPYFTASGFFNIDMTLAYAITGAVTTYLVILLQFNSG